jgi:uncharacterized protein YqeY
MLLEKLNEDYKEAVRNKDEIKRNTINLLLSALKYRQIELRASGKELTDEEIIGVISKEIKKRKEAIELYEKGNRQDLAEKEKRELEILESYMPKQLSEEELLKIIDETIKSVGASSPSDVGKVMKELMPKVKGKADGSLVKSLVEKRLAS